MRRARQGGMTLVETLLALALLGISILMAAAVVTWSLRVEERAREHSLAVDLARTVAECVRAARYDDVREGDIDPTALASEALPSPRIHVGVAEDETLKVKTVTVTVDWMGRRPGRVVLDTAVAAAGPYR